MSIKAINLGSLNWGLDTNIKPAKKLKPTYTVHVSGPATGETNFATGNPCPTLKEVALLTRKAKAMGAPDTATLLSGNVSMKGARCSITWETE